MKIDENYLETLIRDSEKLRVIESLLESPDVYVTDAPVSYTHLAAQKHMLIIPKG